MKNVSVFSAILGLGLLGGAVAAWAHAPLMNCYEEGDDVACEAGYSDGGSATGKAIRVLDANHKLLIEGQFDEDGSFTFKRPPGEFHIVFDGGENHQVTLYDTDLD